MNSNDVNGNKGMQRGIRKITDTVIIAPNKLKEEWEEEFEDIWGNWDEVGYDLNKNDIKNLLKAYLGRRDCEVKISCKLGKIVIEKIEE